MDPNEFSTVHVLMLRKGRFKLGPRFVPAYPLWGSDVHVARWASYDVAALRESFGERWKNDLNTIRTNKLFRVIGEQADGSRVELTGETTTTAPRPRVKQESEPELVRRMVAARARVPGRKPGLGETVHHLADHESVVYERIERILPQIVAIPARAKSVSAYRSEGRRRIEVRGQACSYCDFA